MNNEVPKPNFAAWGRHAVDAFVNELWDDHIKLHEANEQLRLDNKDLSRLLRECNRKGEP